MKKRLFSMAILALSTFFLVVAGCKKNADEPAEVKLNTNAYIAETSSGDIVINCDDEGNPVEIIDAHGEVVDLKDKDVEVVRDEKTGDIVSIKVADQTMAVKEKADEKNAEAILNTAKKVQETKVEIKVEKTSGDKSAKKVETASEQPKESTKTEDSAKKEEKLIPGVNAPELPTGKKTATSEKKTEVTSEAKTEEPVATYTEEAASGTMYGGKGVSQAIYEKAGTEFVIAKDPKTGNNAILYNMAQVTLVGKTSNGWYHIKKYTEYGPLFSERVEGYVPQSALISEATYNEIIKKQQEDEKKKEEEEKSEQPSEKPSETPSEQPSEPASEKPRPSVEVMDQFQQEANGQGQEQGQNNYEISASANRDVFNAINAWRVENGLPEYSWGGENEGIASARACEQTDLVYNKLQEMNHGYGTPWGGLENLCGGGIDVMNAWKTSGGHNAAMLNENKTKCVVYTGYYGGNRGITVALFW